MGENFIYCIPYVCITTNDCLSKKTAKDNIWLEIALRLGYKDGDVADIHLLTLSVTERG